MGACGDGGEILQIGAAEGDVGDADELRALVDGVEHELERQVMPSGEATETISAPWRVEAVVDVVVRGEVEAVGDELVAGAATSRSRT